MIRGRRPRTSRRSAVGGSGARTPARRRHSTRPSRPASGSTSATDPSGSELRARLGIGDAGVQPAARHGHDELPGRAHQRRRLRRAGDPLQVGLAQRLVAALEVVAQVGLGHPRRRGDERERVRVGGAQVPRQVDDAEDLAGRRVVDRSARALPRVDPAVEVLGAEDLDGVVDRDGRPSAFVPAPCSLQSAPQTKCMSCVASITRGGPPSTSARRARPRSPSCARTRSSRR